jgi:dihydroorotase
MDFDLVIRGGEVVDPASGFEGRLDVGIRDGVIVAVDRSLSSENAGEVLDASGQIVTPGLVDTHTHIYWGATYWGIEPDPIAARTGVTTWVDAGSAGAFNFPGFRRWVIETSQARVLSLLNLSSIGLTARTYELATPEYAEVPLARRIVELNRDVIVGIKARIDRSTTRGTGIEPLRRARDLANQVGLPLMVHVGFGPPALEEIVALMRPGDILTHCSTGHDNRVLEPTGSPREFVRVAWDHGLVLDVGHGTGSFSFDVAERMLAEGMPPDVISTDTHQLSIQGPMFDMPTTLSKFLALGMSLPDVIERATSRPAKAIGRPELGGLRPGSAADVALFRLESGSFTFHDIFLTERSGSARLVNTATIRAGRRLERVPMPPLAPWAELPEAQRIYQKSLGEDRQLPLI